MQIQFISDIHDDYPIINPYCDYIALLGDIGDPFTKEYEDFIDQLATKFKKVFVIAGNHEYYYRVMDDVNNKINQICSSNINVYFLNNSSIEVEGILFVGSTLWSKIDIVTAYRTNDFKCIRTSKKKFLDVPTYLQLHKDSVAFIEHEVSKGLPTIVLTHYAPILEMNGKFISSPLRSAYSSNLDYIKGNIRAWLSGHTRQNLSIMKEGVIYASNCKGFSKYGCDNFDPNKSITINLS
jgi:predicted phosphohydrolase